MKMVEEKLGNGKVYIYDFGKLGCMLMKQMMQ